jgi:hypothetical protein
MGTYKCWGAAGEYLGKKYGGNRETTFGGETTGAEAVREVVAELKRKLDPSGEKKREAALNGLDFGRLPDDFFGCLIALFAPQKEYSGQFSRSFHKLRL